MGTCDHSGEQLSADGLKTRGDHDLQKATPSRRTSHFPLSTSHCRFAVGEATWSDWPARRHAARTLFATAVILFMVVVVTLLDAILGALGLVLLVGSNADVLLPTRYRIGADGVEVRNLFRWIRRPWDRFSGWRVVPGGIWLVARDRIKFLRRRRSVWLHCPQSMPQLETILREHLGKPLEAAL